MLGSYRLLNELRFGIKLLSIDAMTITNDNTIVLFNLTIDSV